MSASVADLLAASSSRLTPVERQLAEFVAADPTVLAFGTAAELAVGAGVSRPSVVRFAVKLGFDGYSDLQEHARRQLAVQLKRPVERMWEGADRGASVANLEDALASVAAEMDAGKVTAAANELARARAVWLLSGETSTAGTAVLHSGLSLIRSGVAVLKERTFARDVVSVERGDVVVAISFYRYRQWAAQATERLAGQGAVVIAITDGPLSPLAAHAKIRFELKVPAVGPFDSSVPPVATAELLVAATAKALGRKALKRIERIERMWLATSTFVPDA